MKITTTYLRQVIKEELAKTLNEPLDEGMFDSIKNKISQRRAKGRAKAELKDSQDKLADQFFGNLSRIKNSMTNDEYRNFMDEDLAWIDDKEPEEKKEFIKNTLEFYKKANKAQDDFLKLYRKANPRDTETTAGDLLRDYALNAHGRGAAPVGFNNSDQAAALIRLYSYLMKSQKALEGLANQIG